MSPVALTSRSTSPAGDARQLAELTVLDLEGNEVRLGELWLEQPAVLAFLRHYGWVFCRIHAVQLHRARQELELTGARLVAIGQGTPAHAADFRRTQGIDIPILVDPDRASYSAAGAKIGTLSEVLGPRVMLTGLRRGRPLGLRLGKIDGDLGQLGGVLIVSPDGSIPYSYLSADASDVPSNADVLRAARQAVLALAGSA